MPPSPPISRRSGPCSSHSADDVARRLDGYDLTGALERIWEVVRALNRHVEASAPWQLAKDPDRAAELDAVLYDLADGLRVVATALAAYLPETAPAILAALQQPADLGWDRVAYGLTPPVEGIEPARAVVPAGRGSGSGLSPSVTDTHAHLDACDEPADVLVARARAAGVERIVTIGTGIDSCHRALAIAEANDGVVAALGIDPHQASSPEAGRLGEAARAARPPEGRSRWARPGSTGFTRSRPWPTSGGLLDAHLELAEEHGLPVVIHSREAQRRRPCEALDSFRGTVILHCFSSPELLECALDREYYVSYAGNVTFPRAEALRSTVRRDSRRSAARRDGQPVPRARSRSAVGATSRPTSFTRSPFSRGSAVRTSPGSRRSIDENARVAFGLDVTLVGVAPPGSSAGADTGAACGGIDHGRRPGEPRPSEEGVRPALPRRTRTSSG